MFRSKLLSPLLVLALTPALTAQSRTNWDGVKQLTAGQEIRVVLTDGVEVRGVFLSATDDALMFATYKSQEMLSRIMVGKISSRGKTHRLRNALIGLGAGAGGGLTLGAVIDADSCKNPNVFFGCFQPAGPNIGKEVFTPLGALVGGIVGALLPTGGWRDVYRAK
jgi:hypothetical protein